MTAVTPILQIPEISSSQDQKEVTANTAFELLEAAYGDTLDVDVTSSPVTIADSDILEHFRFRFINATVAGKIVILGTTPYKRLILLRSSSSNTQPILVEHGSNSLTIYPGQTIFVYMNGTANSLDREDTPGKVMPISVTTNVLILPGHAGTYVQYNSSAAGAAIIASNQDSPMDIGTRIWFAQLGTGQLQLAAGTGVTILAARSLSTRAQYSEIWITKIATDTWLAAGDLT